MSYEAFQLQINSVEETWQLAALLANRLTAGSVLTLSGDLGAGKTTFTKGLAQALGIGRNVNSPTFTMIKEYTDGRLPLYHMDVYRLENSDEDLGFDEYFAGDGITVIEWADYIQDFLPSERLAITLSYVSETERYVSLQPYSEQYFMICKELMNESFSH